MTRSSKYINANYRIKVYGVLENGEKINKLVGVSGITLIIGEQFLEKFIDRAERDLNHDMTCM